MFAAIIRIFKQMAFETPFDSTQWSSDDPEFPDKEDPFHGPSAVFDALQIPPMPDGKGVYYQPGAYNTAFVGDFDALGRPVNTMRQRPRATMEIRRRALEVVEWTETFHKDGDAGLARLEATRQQERLERRGIVHAFKETDVCGGGKRLRDCDTAKEMITEAHTFDPSSDEAWLRQDSATNTPVGIGRTRTGGACTDCGLQCGTEVQMENGIPNGVVRFSNWKQQNVQEIRINPYS